MNTKGNTITATTKSIQLIRNAHSDARKYNSNTPLKQIHRKQ